MPLTPERKLELDALCRRFRRDVVEVLNTVQTGHPGASLSVCEILAVLYFEQARLDPARPDWPDRDRIVLSKGHGAPMLYRVMAERGFMPVEEMRTLRQIDSRLQGHPSPIDLPGVDMTSGPLGIALGAALGMALGLRMDGRPSRVYAIIGDGEANEGVVWETCMAAGKFRPDNLTIIMDKNGMQLDGPTELVMPALDLAAKFRAFGLHVIECDGHDVAALSAAVDAAKAMRGVTTIIIADTVKGKGVSFMEGDSSWHSRCIGDEECRLALKELEGGDGH